MEGKANISLKTTFGGGLPETKREVRLYWYKYKHMDEEEDWGITRDSG